VMMLILGENAWLWIADVIGRFQPELIAPVHQFSECHSST
jgi:hypothetical protein